MPSPWSLPDRLRLEARYDGPIPPADPKIHARSEQREALFSRLAAEQRRLVSGRRGELGRAELAQADPVLRYRQEDLRFYRDQGVAWLRG